MENYPSPANNTRLGFHYFPDADHYRESDLRAWVPELQALGASWLTLIAPPDRAIPEPFLRGLISAGIEPIAHFHLAIQRSPEPEDIKPIFEVYARWGLRYVALFDRPNRRRAWSAREWSQDNLVERFMDVFLPLAEAAVRAGLNPVFPPLAPGSDYWDTAFLRTAMQSVKRRASSRLQRKLAIGAYAWADNRALDWGAGGPERWPRARPYHTPKDEQDQLGFRIFDWYQTLASAELGSSPPIIAIGAGSHIGDCSDPDRPEIDASSHADRNLKIARLLLGDTDKGYQEGSSEMLPEGLMAANFWLLTAAPGSRHLRYAWYLPDGGALPVVGALRQWAAHRHSATEEAGLEAPDTCDVEHSRPIAHYLLLPAYEWGISDWHLEVIQPFIKKYRPTVGFSTSEAAHAHRVTVIGGAQSYPEGALDELRRAGRHVTHIDGDGTSIATQLARL